ncbi:hypothetical protein [Crocosphaera sp. XPORK-15E]|uniref:hypothetical protein n=1 Tax=Crocosphaera sp. XPORK-15E TaxID=3110247 RepID=UPI002B2123A2|nr:hypothetical protein [Crocosphaera sp. XPORK-15E]MEA5537005.1 hypothetical protein [Crocosphaera sp. XPORK-15E]
MTISNNPTITERIQSSILVIVEIIILLSLVLVPVALYAILSFSVLCAKFLWLVLVALLFIFPLIEIVRNKSWIQKVVKKLNINSMFSTILETANTIFSKIWEGTKKVYFNFKKDKNNLFIIELFKGKKLSEILHDFFVWRVAIISGLILFYFPLIAQFTGASKFLRNLFVMESEPQLTMVIVVTFIIATIIISLLMSIIILSPETPPIRYNVDFIIKRIVGAIVLSFPTYLVLYFNNSKPDVNWYFFWGVSIILILVFLLFYVIIEYNQISENKDVNPFSILRTIDEKILHINTNNAGDKIDLFLIYEILIGLIIYVITIYLNYPKLDGTINIPIKYQAPTLLYILLIIWIVTIVLGGIIYVFDKYSDKYHKPNNSSPSNSQENHQTNKLQKYQFHWPVILLLILFTACGYRAWNVDHYFQLKNSDVVISNYQKDFKTAIGNRLCPEDFQKEQRCNKEQSLVVVAASGGGIQASGWTAQVLAGLQNKIGEDFTKAIGLISSTSGGSVGTMFYLNQFNDQGILSEPQKLIKNATDDWLDSVGWGLAYPDLVSAIGFPFF